MPNPNTFIVGFTGKAGTGKSTVAGFLRKAIKETGDYKHAIRIESFANPLRREVANKFGVSASVSKKFKDRRVKVGDRVNVGNSVVPVPNSGSLTVRQLLQWWGTDVRRSRDPNYWVKKMGAYWGRLKKKHGNGNCILIIDDVRFPNEAKWIREQGGVIIRLDPYPGYEGAGSHASEMSVDRIRADYQFTPGAKGVEKLEGFAIEISSFVVMWAIAVARAKKEKRRARRKNLERG